MSENVKNQRATSPASMMEPEDGGSSTACVLSTSFSVVYCPFDSCFLDKPFKEARVLLSHLEESHSVRIHNPQAIQHLLDRYLAQLKAQGLLSGLEIELGKKDSIDAEIREMILKEKLV